LICTTFWTQTKLSIK